MVKLKIIKTTSTTSTENYTGMFGGRYTSGEKTTIKAQFECGEWSCFIAIESIPDVAQIALIDGVLVDPVALSMLSSSAKNTDELLVNLAHIAANNYINVNKRAQS